MIKHLFILFTRGFVYNSFFEATIVAQKAVRKANMPYKGRFLDTKSWLRIRNRREEYLISRAATIP